MGVTRLDIRTAIDNLDEQWDEFDETDRWDRDYYWPFEELEGEGSLEAPGLGKLIKVAKWGGEGDGTDQFMVFRVEGDDQLFQVSGYYSSYGDGENPWDGSIQKVEAYQTVVTRYRMVK